MRDVNRIDIILEELRKYWKKNPDLRLGQILCNIGRENGFSKDPFYMEDTDLLNTLTKYNNFKVLTTI